MRGFFLDSTGLFSVFINFLRTRLLKSRNRIMVHVLAHICVYFYSYCPNANAAIY